MFVKENEKQSRRKFKDKREKKNSVKSSLVIRCRYVPSKYIKL